MCYLLKGAITKMSGPDRNERAILNTYDDDMRSHFGFNNIDRKIKLCHSDISLSV